MKKILITGINGMLANDFVKVSKGKFEIFGFDKKGLNITDLENIKEKINRIRPDIILNLAAYTNVDDAQDIGLKLNYEINSLGVYNLAKISGEKNIDFITISTDYIFDGKNKNGYDENENENPINQYGMAKFLGEKLAKTENKNSIIIRTSWLYGGGKDFKNFVNTIIKLGKKEKELKIINNQFGNPTNCVDLSKAICELIQNIGKNRGKIFHFSNKTELKGISWLDFANEIFSQSGIFTKVIPCNSDEYKTKAKRPKFSKLNNNSEIFLQDWKKGLKDYLDNL